MRLVSGVGVDWNCDWLIEHLLKENLSAVDLDEGFENFMGEVYPEPTVAGFMRFNTAQLMKEMDPIAWNCALSDWQSQEESDEQIMCFDNGSTFYRREDVEAFIHEHRG